MRNPLCRQSTLWRKTAKKRSEYLLVSDFKNLLLLLIYQNPTQMKKYIPSLLVIGLMFNACGPSEEEARETEVQIEADSAEAMDDILKMADEAFNEIELDSTASEQIVDSLMVEEDAAEEVE